MNVNQAAQLKKMSEYTPVYAVSIDGLIHSEHLNHAAAITADITIGLAI